MSKKNAFFLGLVLGQASTVFGATNDQVDAPIDYGTFSNPSSIVRPRFRYWLPDSSVDPNTVKDDIKSAASIGAGGVEFLPFFGYGGTMNAEPPGANWAVSNFGTPEFLSVFQAALEAHKESGLQMDFAMGPNQGQGVPARTDDEGLQWDLVPYTEPIPQSGKFNQIIPGWAIGDLVAVVSAEVLSQQTISYELESIAGTSNITYKRYVLKAGTLVEQTKRVNRDTGALSLEFPTGGNKHYQLFTFYQKLSLHKNLEFPVTADTTIFDNGSYVVDHYSSQGAETITRFWEDYILKNDTIKNLLLQVGNYGWEDSIEINSNITWSRSMLERFERLKGYSIKPILPLLAFQENNLATQTVDGTFQCVLDQADQGAGYVNDFRDVQEAGYREYLQTLVNWTNQVLNLQFSAQPSYNLPMDMLVTIPDVNAPECESLGFSDNIDLYRQFTGPAQLGGKRIISNELGAVAGKAFQYPVPSLLFSANRGFSAGINRYVIHGQAFTGNYYATTWPGYVPWGYIFSETWNNKQPVWDHGFSEAIDYLARSQQVLQTGVPKTDIAFFWKQSATTMQQLYNTTEFIQAGWSYTYLSPDNFAMPQATAKAGILAPDGPAWQAMIVHSSQNLTVYAVDKLSEYAAAGLPILFADGTPGFYPSGDGSSKAQFLTHLGNLMRQKNVYRTSWEGLPEELSRLHITPRIATRTNGTIYTAWRVSPQDAVEYAFLFSDTVASVGEIIAQTKKRPYWFNAWTGERTPVLVYTQDATSTIIPLSLKANQTAILTFSDYLANEIITPSFHITSIPENILGYGVNDHSNIEVKVGASSTPSALSLSTGRKVKINAKDISLPFTLDKWNLVAEQWDAPQNLSEQAVIASKRNSTYKLNKLISWTDIPELHNASGVGYYTTTFTWPPSNFKTSHGIGAYITLSQVLNTARVWVNGQKVAPLDVNNAVADVSTYLRSGKNKVEVQVATVMWNYLASIMGELENAGIPPLLESYAGQMSFPQRVDVGLVGEVVVTPFESIKISA